jgi:hypothetical protein
VPLNAKASKGAIKIDGFPLRPAVLKGINISRPKGLDRNTPKDSKNSKPILKSLYILREFSPEWFQVLIREAHYS